MKTIKDKEILVGADFAGFPLKEAVVEHLQKYGWKVTDVGVKKDSDPDDTDLMFHRILLYSTAFCDLPMRICMELAKGQRYYSLGRGKAS